MKKNLKWFFMKKIDVSYETPKITVPLTYVGFSSIKIPLVYIFKGKTYVVYPSFDVFVDLPKSMRGINFSRSYEVLYEAIKKFSNTESRVEDVAKFISEELLKVHEYSTKSLVNFKFELTLKKTTLFSKKESLLNYEIEGFSKLSRNKNSIETIRSIGLTATGMNACPCAQNEIRHIYASELHKKLKNKINEEHIKKYIDLTHTQRVKATLKLETKEILPNFYFFIDILESSFSAPVIHLLKRVDEANLIINAARNPKFVEDVAREIILRFYKNYKEKLKNEDKISVIVESFESIHPHNAIAIFMASGKEIKKVIYDVLKKS